MTKQLLDLFGFEYHIAPGEAEAECALLQREGLVDAVLSEDVDTLMFGCGLTLRNWTSEGSRGSKAPTHVSLYDAERTRAGKSGLDRQGMILVAMMSGGDYDTGGIPGCGIKIACEAARAGFGKSLCALQSSDAEGITNWRESLARELRTNESKHFKRKHAKLTIPEKFPDVNILKYYTNPAMSSQETVQTLKKNIRWDRDVDVVGLRRFVEEAFDWRFKTGAKCFIRGLAPSLMVLKLRTNRTGVDPIQSSTNDEDDAEGLVRAICGKRESFQTDGLEELRVKCIPLDVVGFDLDAEASDDGYVGGDADSDEDIPSSAVELSPSKRRQPSAYDPTIPENIWILGTYVRCGARTQVEAWEEALRQPKKSAATKAPSKRSKTKASQMAQRGSMDRFVKVTKSRLPPPPKVALKEGSPARRNIENTKLPLSSAKGIDDGHTRSNTIKSSSQNIGPDAVISETTQPKRSEAQISKEAHARSTEMISSPKQASPWESNRQNPWTLSRRCPEAVFSPQKVNRRLNFLPPDLKLHSGLVTLDDDDSLPELQLSSKGTSAQLPSVQRTPSPRATTRVVDILSSSPEIAPAHGVEASSSLRQVSQETLPSDVSRPSRLFALRESLEGAWKEVDEFEARTRAKVFRDVEIVDLSGRVT